MKPRILIINTLGGALHHYAEELTHVLDASADVHVRTLLEPSSSGRSGMRWVGTYVKALLSTRRFDRRNPLIVTWPVLGYLDILLATITRRRTWVTVHDPIPLVRSVGNGPVARFVVRRMGHHARIITHSAEASRIVAGFFPRAHVAELPHPMIRPQSRAQVTGQRRIRVLGQYKPDRDIDALVRIARDLDDAELTITGRGWPAIDGWSVDDRFVPEDELDRLITTADVVIIPYTRFYQSGIAVRCLEHGVPVVGPSGTWLDRLLGAEPELLVDEPQRTWAHAIEHALSLGVPRVLALACDEQAAVDARWAIWSANRSQHA